MQLLSRAISYRGNGRAFSAITSFKAARSCDFICSSFNTEIKTGIALFSVSCWVKVWEIIHFSVCTTSDLNRFPILGLSCYVSVTGNSIFVTGGYFRDEVVWYCVDWVLIYNSWENSWMEGPAMRQSRNWHSAVGVGAHLYVLGGSTDEAVIADVERLPLTNKEWEGMQPMVQPVERAAVVSIGAKIYVLCGLDENGDVYSGVQRLDVDSDVWDVISFSPVPRYDLCATLLNGAVYVMGGQTFRLDTDTDEWTPVDEECLNEKFFSGCATVNGKIFLLGERRGNTSIPNMILIDPYTDTCQVVDTAVPCPLPVRGCVSIRKFIVRSGV
uniref:kelch-like protein 23 n=1 Tax=Pristiophorus japonicus TaxID=55135 RepID=UPI00398E5EF1